MKQNNAWVIEGCFAGGWRLLEIALTRREIRLVMKGMRFKVGEGFGPYLRIRKVVVV